MMMDDLERSLLDAGKVQPGAEVRARVLAAATPLVRPDRSHLDRIWFSRRWRMAAVLAALLLAVLNAVSPNTAASTLAAQDVRPAGNTQVVAMAAREAGLTPDVTVVLCAQAIAAARTVTATEAGADMLAPRSNQ